MASAGSKPRQFCCRQPHQGAAANGQVNRSGLPEGARGSADAHQGGRAGARRPGAVAQRDHRQVWRRRDCREARAAGAGHRGADRSAGRLGSYVRKVPAARCLEHDRLQFPGSPFGIDESGERRGRPADRRPAGGAIRCLGAPHRAGRPAAARREAPCVGGADVGSVSHRDEVPDDSRWPAGAAGDQLRAGRAHRGYRRGTARAGQLRRTRRHRADALDRHRDRSGGGGHGGAARACWRRRRPWPCLLAQP